MKDFAMSRITSYKIRVNQGRKDTLYIAQSVCIDDGRLVMTRNIDRAYLFTARDIEARVNTVRDIAAEFYPKISRVDSFAVTTELPEYKGMFHEIADTPEINNALGDTRLDRISVRYNKEVPETDD